MFQHEFNCIPILNPAGSSNAQIPQIISYFLLLFLPPFLMLKLMLLPYLFGLLSLFCCFGFWDKVLSHSHGWSGTWCVDPGWPWTHKAWPVSASSVLELKVSTAISRLVCWTSIVLVKCLFIFPILSSLLCQSNDNTLYSALSLDQISLFH